MKKLQGCKGDVWLLCAVALFIICEVATPSVVLRGDL